MAEIKWIKLSVDMFNDEKIRIIERMPEADTLLVIFVKLLAQAGKVNDHGLIYLTPEIPYTDDMLATIFGRDVGIVRYALETFRKFGMIEINEQHICITNWDKHQNVVGMDKVKEQNRLRKQRERERKKLSSPSSLDVSRDNHVTVTQNHATDIDIDKELEIDKERKHKRVQSNDYTQAFESFWSIYPRKKEKRKAFTVWKARLREGVSEDLLIKCSSNYAAFVNREGTEERFIKHAATFLGPSKPYEEYTTEVQQVERKQRKGERGHAVDGVVTDYGALL